MSDQEFFTAWQSTDALETARGSVNAALAAAREKTVVYVDSATTTALTLDGSQDVVLVDCTTDNVTITLPADPDTDEPGAGYSVVRVDGSGNTLTVARNGKPINGAASDDTISTQHQAKDYLWSADATYGWHRTTRSA